MKRLFAVLLICLFIAFLFSSPAFALTLNVDAYPDAFDTKDYTHGNLRKYPVPSEDSDPNCADEYYLYGPVVEDGPSVNIDKVCLTYPTWSERYNEAYEEKLEYEYNTTENHVEISINGRIIASNEILEELGSWEWFIDRGFDDYERTTLNDRPAIVQESGTRVSTESTEDEYIYEAYMLIDENNVIGSLILRVRVILRLELIRWSSTAVESNEENKSDAWGKWYEDTLIPLADEYKEKASDVTVSLKRERIYEGELGVAGSTNENPEDVKPIDVTVDTDADTGTGETSIPVPEAVAIAVLGIGAAIAGAAAGGSDKSGNGSRYRMCLRKDFGDAIRIGASPVPIYARIVELSPDGREIDRPDLTGMISIESKGYLQVDGCQMAGNYMGAMVYAPEKPGERKPYESAVSIGFAGDVGSLTNNVNFHIIDKPYIEFPKRGDYLEMTMNLLLGDGKTYETPFIPKDFMNQPEVVRVKAADGAPFEADYDKTDEGGYVLHIKNISKKPDNIVLQKISSYLKINAENKEEKAESSVKVELYPEGLSISNVPIQDKIVQFPAFDNEETSEYGDVEPTRFDLHLVVPRIDSEGKTTVEVVEPKDFDPVFEGLKGEDERTANLCDKFRYEIEPVSSNLKRYEFAPQEALVEDENNPFHVKLPVSCTYGESSYSIELPVRLIGGGPGPMEERSREIEKMKRIIGKVGGISSNVAKQLRNNRDSMSAAELRLVNKQICQDSINYFTKEAAEFNETADTLQTMEYWADWIKWFGDQAFSYLMTVYTGSGEIILTPAKEMCVDFIAELVADNINGTEFSSMDFSARLEKLNALKKIDTMIENFLMSVATGENISIRKAAACLAGWFVYKVAKNIQDNVEKTGNYNVFDSILLAGRDLTGEAMKRAGMKQFEKLLNNSKVRSTFESWFGDFVGKHLQNNLQSVLEDSGLVKIEELATRSEAVKKLMEGLMGEGINWTFNKFNGKPDPKAGKQVASHERISLTGDGTIKVVLITPNEKTGEGYVAELNILNSFKGVFQLFFGDVFGDVPFEKAPKEQPKDPVLYNS